MTASTPHFLHNYVRYIKIMFEGASLCCLKLSCQLGDKQNFRRMKNCIKRMQWRLADCSSSGCQVPVLRDRNGNLEGAQRRR
jgi:hypothetical protein